MTKALSLLPLLLLWPLFALAQAAPPNPDDGLALAQLFISAIQSGNALLALPVGVMLVLLVFRKFLLPNFEARWPWLADKRLTLALAVLGPMAAAVLTAVLAGQPITFGLIATALLAGLGGVGLWSGQKNWREAAAAPPAGTVGSVVIGKPPGEGLR